MGRRDVYCIMGRHNHYCHDRQIDGGGVGGSNGGMDGSGNDSLMVVVTVMVAVVVVAVVVVYGFGSLVVVAWEWW